MNFDQPLDDNPLDPVEAYCVHCKETVEMDNPVAVWTRRGMPATRGECPICGGTVFRMGKSSVHEHQDLDKPETSHQGQRVKLARETVYVGLYDGGRDGCRVSLPRIWSGWACLLAARVRAGGGSLGERSPSRAERL